MQHAMGLMGLIGLMGPIGLIGLMGPIRDSWALLVQLAKKRQLHLGTAFIRYSEKMVAC